MWSGCGRETGRSRNGYGGEVMPLRTRAEIYGKEAAALLQEVSLYPGIRREQIHGLHPGKETTVHNLLAHLERQGRIAEAEKGGFYPYGGCPRAPDSGMVRAVWVLLDLKTKADGSCNRNHIPSRKTGGYILERNIISRRIMQGRLRIYIRVWFISVYPMESMRWRAPAMITGLPGKG